MNKFIPTIVSRPQSSNLMNVLVPVIAVILTLLTGSIIFSIMGFNVFFALHIFFISPISSSYGISELLVKATPLALIAIGLAFCFKNNIYNIGAEGQLTMGAIFGGGIGIYFYDTNGIQQTRGYKVLLLAGKGIGGGTSINWTTSLRTPDKILSEWDTLTGQDNYFNSNQFKDSMDYVCNQLNVDIIRNKLLLKVLP